MNMFNPSYSSINIITQHVVHMAQILINKQKYQSVDCEVLTLTADDFPYKIICQNIKFEILAHVQTFLLFIFIINNKSSTLLKKKNLSLVKILVFILYDLFYLKMVEAFQVHRLETHRS